MNPKSPSVRRAGPWLAVLCALAALGGVIGLCSPSSREAGEAKTGIPDEERIFEKSAEPLEFQDGDSVVFVGDSITQDGRFVSYLETFMRTRYPDRRITFRAAGVSGDRAEDVLQRFDDDVAIHDPDYVIVLLGMNDARFRKFSGEVFETFERDVAALLARIQTVGAVPVLLSPTIYDARAALIYDGEPGEPLNTFYNGVMAFYGEYLRELAMAEGHPFADLHGPLAGYTMQQRRNNPNFSLVPDSVHPDPNGHVVMAIAMLDDLFPRSPVSAVHVKRDPAGMWEAGATNAEVTDLRLEGESGVLRFTVEAKALPWVLPPEARLGHDLTKAGHRHSAERLRIQGLEPGRYELAIGGEEVGVYDSGQLAAGIELQANELTPQYRQAKVVSEYIERKFAETVRPLGGLHQARKEKRAGLEEWQAENPGSSKAAEKKAELDEWLRDFEKWTATHLRKIREMDEEIYTLNQPQPLVYELRPAFAED